MKRDVRRMCIGFLGLFAAITATGHAQAADSPKAAAPAAQRSITLTLLDATTGMPVAGASVRSSPSRSQEPELKSDSSGKAVLALPEQRSLYRFTITVTPPQHLAREALWSSTTRDVLEQIPAQHTIKLNPPITIGGFVKDSAGRPVAGAELISSMISPTDSPPGRDSSFIEHDSDSRRRQSGETLTDSNGFWTQSGHSPELELFWINVRRPGGGIVQFATAAELRPDTEGVVELSDKALRATNAVMSLPDGATWRGLVVDEAGRPIPGATLREQPMQRNIIASTSTYTNGADGKFELPHRIIPYGRLTAEAPGHAIASLQFHPDQDPDQLRVVLPAANPVRLRLMRGNEPVAGVTLMPQEFRMRQHLLSWRGQTDAQGRVVWSNAPLDTVVLRTLPTKYPPQVIRVDPTNRDVVVRVRAYDEQHTSVQIRAIDASDGRPIPAFDVLRAEGFAGEFRPYGKAGADGLFLSPSNNLLSMLTPFRLKVRASGYRDVLQTGLYAEDGDQQFTIGLIKLKPKKGVALQPNGSPAANATLLVNTTEEAVIVADNMSANRVREGLESSRTSADGSFSLPQADDMHHLFLSHPSGFASFHLSDWPASNRIVLQPWARLEGTLRPGGNVLVNEQLILRQPLDSRLADHFTFIHSTSMRQNGRFIFTNLVPGEYLLYRPQRSFNGLVYEEYYRLPVTILAGVTNRLEYKLGGRTVVGQLFANGQINWQNDRYTLRLKLPPPPMRLNPLMTEPFEPRRLQRDLARRPQSVAYERKSQQFQLQVAADGSFRADDIPPGEYELRGVVLQPLPQNASPSFRETARQSLGAIQATVVVPDDRGTGDLDLGVFEVALTTIAALPSLQPLTMPGVTLDGKPFDLTSTRGKPAVVLFWAAWAPASRAQLAEFGRLQAQLDVTQAAFVSVNLDEQPAAAERALSGLGLERWTHVRLAGKARTEVTERLEINSLPTLVLLNRDGAIISRNVAPAKVPATLARLAAPSPKE